MVNLRDGRSTTFDLQAVLLTVFLRFSMACPQSAIPVSCDVGYRLPSNTIRCFSVAV